MTTESPRNAENFSQEKTSPDFLGSDPDTATNAVFQQLECPRVSIGLLCDVPANRIALVQNVCSHCTILVHERIGVIDYAELVRNRLICEQRHLRNTTSFPDAVGTGLAVPPVCFESNALYSERSLEYTWEYITI